MEKLSYLLIFVILSGIYGLQVNLDKEWEKYKEHFNKTYSSDCQEKIKKKNWEENLEFILHHNLEADMGIHNFTVGLNKFSDMSSEEFSELMTGYKPNGTLPTTEIYSPPPDVKVNDTVDYREKGMVTEPENQGQCASDYGFCTCAVLEAMHKKAKGKLVPLSIQNIVDCSASSGNNGCNGGYVENTLSYVFKNKGLNPKSSYPYTGKQGNCSFDPKKLIAPACSSTKLVEKNNEKALQAAVGTTGPVAVAIKADTKSFQNYKEGIYSDPACSEGNVDHCVTIVGYGTESGLDFWIIKNSWGTKWGEKGFFRMVRNKNMCKVATHGVFCE